MYPWNVQRDNLIWNRRKIEHFLEGSRTAKLTLEIKTRLWQSSLIHVSYRRIYTTALERWPYTGTHYYFSNEWSEDWGKVMKWEDQASSTKADTKAKYEFFIPSVTSKDDLKERLQQLILWIHSNIK